MKKILCIILAALLIIGLAACGSDTKEGTPGATVVKLMDGLKNYDEELLRSVFANPADEDVLEEEADVVAGTLALVKSWASNMKYTVKSYKINGDSAEVPVKVTYTDASAVMQNAVNTYLSQAIALAALYGDEVSEDDLMALFEECVQNASETEKIGSITETITIKVVKIGDEWKIEDLTNEMMNVFYSNMLSTLNNFTKE